MAVYFVRAGAAGPVKIGYARDVRRRIALLQTGNADRLILIRCIAGDRAGEAAAHRAFAEQWLSGEWFSFVESMLTYGEAAGEEKAPTRRNRVTFHPIVQEIIDRGEYSHQAVCQWRTRGVPWQVCCKAFAMADERGLPVDPDMAEFRAVNRRVPTSVGAPA